MTILKKKEYRRYRETPFPSADGKLLSDLLKRDGGFEERTRPRSLEGALLDIRNLIARISTITSLS